MRTRSGHISGEGRHHAYQDRNNRRRQRRERPGAGAEGRGARGAGGREDRAAIRETAFWGEVVALAVPFGAIDDVVKDAGEALAGKTVVDVTNAIDASMNLAVGFTTSGAEELQRKLPMARIVKDFTTEFAQH